MTLTSRKDRIVNEQSAHPDLRTQVQHGPQLHHVVQPGLRRADGSAGRHRIGPLLE
jgi:hypothetical protein